MVKWHVWKGPSNHQTCAAPAITNESQEATHVHTKNHKKHENNEIQWWHFSSYILQIPIFQVKTMKTTVSTRSCDGARPKNWPCAHAHRSLIFIGAQRGPVEKVFSTKGMPAQHQTCTGERQTQTTPDQKLPLLALWQHNQHVRHFSWKKQFSKNTPRAHSTFSTFQPKEWIIGFVRSERPYFCNISVLFNRELWEYRNSNFNGQPWDWALKFGENSHRDSSSAIKLG